MRHSQDPREFPVWAGQLIWASIFIIELVICFVRFQT